MVIRSVAARGVVSLSLLGCALAGCGQSWQSPQRDAAIGAHADEEPRFRATTLGAADPAFVLGDVYLAGQPAQGDVAVWAKIGVNTVVSLTKPDALSWDEAREVRVANMRFVSVPFDAPEELTDKLFADLRELLRDKSRRPLVLHAPTGDQLGAVWMPFRVLDDDADSGVALEEAVRAGMKKATFVKKSRDYIRQESAPK